MNENIFDNKSLVDEALKKIEDSIETDVFKKVESEFIELKDLSSGKKWNSLYETVCAFLNTNGGLIITGVYEKKDAYNINGYNRDNEPRYLDLPNRFKSFTETPLNLLNFITYNIRNVLDSEVCIIHVKAVPDDLKHVFFNRVAYERKLTADIKVLLPQIKAQEDYKKDLEFAKELLPVKTAGIEDLDLDKVNGYIQLLNRDVKIYSFKANIKNSESFLLKQHFYKESYVTTLGILVCGKEPFQLLENRVEVDCYVESSTGNEIAKNKKILRGDVIYLMEETLRFISNNISVTLSSVEGGTSIPEYPESILREIINNAIAHRDYDENKFIVVSITPNKKLSISNPGSFKDSHLIDVKEEDLKIKRVIPGQTGSKNPKLANVLKVFDKWEGRGRGMALLVNLCLDNKIDIPYFKISNLNEITLVVRSGKLLDEAVTTWLESFENYIIKRKGGQLEDKHKIILAYLYKSELENKIYRFTILLNMDNSHSDAIEELIACNLIYESNKSPRFNPVFLVDRTLSKKDFIDELKKYYRNHLEYLDNLELEILNIVYRYNFFNQSQTSARQIGPELLINKKVDKTDFRELDNFNRKIRKICGQLVDNNFLKKGDKGYTINTNYLEESSGIQTELPFGDDSSVIDLDF